MFLRVNQILYALYSIIILTDLNRFYVIFGHGTKIFSVDCKGNHSYTPILLNSSFYLLNISALKNLVRIGRFKSFPAMNG
jgi:hypothetical protein